MTLRVLSLANALNAGGTANRIYGMIAGADPNKVDHRVAVLQEPQAALEEHFGSFRPMFEALGVPVESLHLQHPAPGTVMSPLRRMKYSLRAMSSSVARLCDLIRRDRIDVIDAHLAPATVVAAMAGAKTGTPVVVTDYHVGAPAPVLCWPLVGRYALDRARYVVTDSEERANEMRSWIYRRRNKVRVIPNGIPPPPSALTRDEARERFGVRPGERVVLQMSALQPHKGHKILLEAAARVLASDPNVRFLIVGVVRGTDDSYPRELDELARSLGIAQKVFIGPYPGPVGDVWRAADFQAHASLWDSLPNAIIEGMSLGIPAAVTAVGAVPETITNGENGMLVQPGDAAGLAEALTFLLQHPAQAERIGAAARRYYESHFLPEIVSRQLAQLFEECVH